MKLRWHVWVWCSLWYWLLVDHYSWIEVFYYGLCVLLPWWWLARSNLFARTGHEAWLSLNPWWWLKFVRIFLKEFTIANYKLFLLTWSPKALPEARWIEVRTRSRSGFGRMLIANFISLTPGTISWDIDPDKEGATLSVHLLNRREEAGVQDLVDDLDPLVIQLTEPQGEGRDYALDP